MFEPSPAVPPTLDRARALSAESALAEPTTAPLERALGAPITGQPAPAESEVGEPTMAPSAAATAAAPEPPPALVPTVDEPPAPAAVPTGLPEPVVASPGLALTTAGMSWPGSGLVEGGVRIRSEMIAFIWRETEHGLALGRELLASRSLPEILTLQTAYLGETLERTVAQGLEVARLSTDLLRAGGRSTRAD